MAKKINYKMFLGTDDGQEVIKVCMNGDEKELNSMIEIQNIKKGMPVETVGQFVEEMKVHLNPWITTLEVSEEVQKMVEEEKTHS